MVITKFLATMPASCAIIFIGIILDYSDLKVALLIGGIGMIISTIYTGTKRKL